MVAIELFIREFERTRVNIQLMLIFLQSFYEVFYKYDRTL
jgi:hypothetical protein